MTERIRFTISVEPEVYEAFADLAHTSGVSLSRCIGDWLRDTAESAQITTLKLQEVRRSPQEAFDRFMREALVPETLRHMAISEGRGAKEAARSAARPPSSNTGGKSPQPRARR